MVRSIAHAQDLSAEIESSCPTFWPFQLLSFVSLRILKLVQLNTRRNISVALLLNYLRWPPPHRSRVHWLEYRYEASLVCVSNFIIQSDLFKVCKQWTSSFVTPCLTSDTDCHIEWFHIFSPIVVDSHYSSSFSGNSQPKCYFSSVVSPIVHRHVIWTEE